MKIKKAKFKIKNIKNFFKNQNGLTLIELLIAAAIFIFVIQTLGSIMTGLFNLQRRAIIIQNMQENTRFALEMISREIKLTQKSNTTNDPDQRCVPSGKNFNLVGDSELKFINHLGQCITYKLDETLKTIKREVDIAPFDGIPEQSGKITAPSMVKVLSLKFAKDASNNILGDAIGDNKQPKVIIMLKIEANDPNYKPVYNIQTAVSQRELDVQ